MKHLARYKIIEDYHLHTKKRHIGKLQVERTSRSRDIMVIRLKMPTPQLDENIDNEDNFKRSAPKIYAARQILTNISVSLIQ
jgi:hypothetical protein